MDQHQACHVKDRIHAKLRRLAPGGTNTISAIRRQAPDQAPGPSHEGEITTRTDQIAAELVRHWGRMFGDAHIDEAALQSWLRQNLHPPSTVPPANAARWHIRKKDVARAIRCSGNSLPGPDRIPYVAWRRLGRPLGSGRALRGGMLHGLPRPPIQNPTGIRPPGGGGPPIQSRAARLHPEEGGPRPPAPWCGIHGGRNTPALHRRHGQPHPRQCVPLPLGAHLVGVGQPRAAGFPSRPIHLSQRRRCGGSGGGIRHVRGGPGDFPLRLLGGIPVYPPNIPPRHSPTHRPATPCIGRRTGPLRLLPLRTLLRRGTMAWVPAARWHPPGVSIISALVRSGGGRLPPGAQAGRHPLPDTCIRRRLLNCGPLRSCSDAHLAQIVPGTCSGIQPGSQPAQDSLLRSGRTPSPGPKPLSQRFAQIGPRYR